MASGFQARLVSRVRAGFANWVEETVAGLPMMVGLLACGIVYAVYPDIIIVGPLIFVGLNIVLFGMAFVRALRDEPEAALGMILIGLIALVAVTCAAVLAYLSFPAFFGR